MPCGSSGVPVGADGHGRGGGVVGREDVAGTPADLGAERGQRLDQHRGLRGHVQRAGDAGALERLRVGVLGAGRPSGPASRARPARSACGRRRPGSGRRPCSPALVVSVALMGPLVRWSWSVVRSPWRADARASPARSAASPRPGRRRDGWALPRARIRPRR